MEPHGSLWPPAMCWWEHVKDGGTLNILDHNWEMLSTEMLEKVVVMFVFGGAANYSLVGFWWSDEGSRWRGGLLVTPAATCSKTRRATDDWMDALWFIYFLFVFFILSRSQIVIDSVFVSKNQAHGRNSHRISWTPVWVCCHWSITGRTTWDIFFLFLGDFN